MKCYHRVRNNLSWGTGFSDNHAAFKMSSLWQISVLACLIPPTADFPVPEPVESGHCVQQLCEQSNRVDQWCLLPEQKTPHHFINISITRGGIKQNLVLIHMLTSLVCSVTVKTSHTNMNLKHKSGVIFRSNNTFNKEKKVKYESTDWHENGYILNINVNYTWQPL